MAKFTPQQLSTVLSAARAIDYNWPMTSVADFAIATLALNPAEQGQFFAVDGPKNLLAVTNKLSSERDELLVNQGRIPSFALRVRTGQPSEIGGIGTALALSGVSAKTTTRLTHREAVRNSLRTVERGHNLEAIAAAILAACCDSSSVTKGSGDQGVDGLAWKAFLPLNQFCCPRVNPEDAQNPFAWEKVVVIASSKAHMGNTDEPGLINPAFIRELVGSWIIQRTPIGKWNDSGILPLSPVQLILATTYRISSSAREECRSLGVQIWSLPELTSLVCEFAPDNVFPHDGLGAFDGHAFRTWWLAKAATRIGTAGSAASVGV